MYIFSDKKFKNHVCSLHICKGALQSCQVILSVFINKENWKETHSLSWKLEKLSAKYPSCHSFLLCESWQLCIFTASVHRSCAGTQRILIISWKLLPVCQKLITAIVSSTLRNIISFLNLLVCIWALISKWFAFKVQLLVFVSLLICSGMKSHQQGSAEANLLSGWMGSSSDVSSRFELTIPRIWISF